MSLYDNAKLYLYFNGTPGDKTISDLSPSSHSITFVKSSVLSNTQTKIGSTSLYLPGDQSYIYANDSDDFTLGTNDFWMEGYFFVKSNARQALICMGSSGSFEYMLEISGSNTLRWVVVNSTVQVSLTNSWTPTPNTWYHIGFGRSSGNYYMFVDGVQIGVTQYNTYNIPNYGGKFLLGIQADLSTIPFNGYIDYFIFLNGVCRYTSNFTPPTDANFLNSALAKDLEISYNIGDTINKDIQLVYDIHSRVHQDIPIYYSIKEGIYKDCQFINRIGDLIGRNLEFDYNIYQVVFNNLNFVYNIGFTVYNDLEFPFDLSSPIFKNLSLNFNIGDIVSKDLDIQYDLVSAVGKSLNVTYNIRSKVFRQIRTIYDILSLIAKNLELQYGIRTVVSKDSILLYNIFNTCSKSLENQYNIYNSIGQSCVLEYNIISQILASIYRDLILKYNIPKKDIVVNLIIPDKIKINIRLD